MKVLLSRTVTLAILFVAAMLFAVVMSYKAPPDHSAPIVVAQASSHQVPAAFALPAVAHIATVDVRRPHTGAASYGPIEPNTYPTRDVLALADHVPSVPVVPRC